MLVEIKNTDKVIKVLKKNNEIAIEKLKKSLEEGAKLVEAEAKKLVPKDTGNLRDSIKCTATFDMKTGYGIAVGTEKRDDFYAQFIEYGADSSDPKHTQAAQPFMRPACDNKKDSIVQLMNKAIDEALEDV